MQKIKSKGKQKGALILVVLVILLAVTWAGISMMDTTGLEMKMSSNSRDQQQAFEAAEYALSWVENNINITNGYSDDSLSDSNCGTTCFDSTCSNGYCFNGSNPLDWQNCLLGTPTSEPYEDPDLWDDNTLYRTLDIPNMGLTAKYIVEFNCYTVIDTSIPMDVANNAKIYQVTTFVTGQANSRVMLRSKMKVI